MWCRETSPAAGSENAEVTGDDLPVVLRHSHGHDLVGALRKEKGPRPRFAARQAQQRSGIPGCGICNAVRCGYFSAERLKIYVSHVPRSDAAR